MSRRTKIGATIGPACEQLGTLLKMVKAGMNFARLNFSHGTHQSHARLVKAIRQAAKAADEPIAIMQDLRGPKIRIGVMPPEGLELKAGKKVNLNIAAMEYKGGDIPLPYPRLQKWLRAGQRLLIDDGRIELKIKRVYGVRLICEVREGGIIFSNKGVNFPDSRILSPTLNQKDKDDLKFGLRIGVDTVALSFVQTARDVFDLRRLIEQAEKEAGGQSKQPVSVIAKIERHTGVDNIDEILKAADGIMVARGDLGLEMPAAEVPLVQKRLIEKANALAKPVIVATQMLDSMQRSRRPTRAEVSDVANAVIDHTDAVLLTNETAVGKHPALVVKTMSEIIAAAENSKYDDLKITQVYDSGALAESAVTELSRLLAEEVGAKLILAASLTGETGRLISRVRPELPILVATETERVRRQLNISWGIRPFILLPCRSIEELVKRSVNYIKSKKLAKKGDKMIVVAGEPVGQAGNVNLVEVKEV